MNDVVYRQIKNGSYLSLCGITTVQLLTKHVACGTANSVIHATTAKQTTISVINDNLNR